MRGLARDGIVGAIRSPEDGNRALEKQAPLDLRVPRLEHESLITSNEADARDS